MMGNVWLSQFYSQAYIDGLLVKKKNNQPPKEQKQNKQKNHPQTNKTQTNRNKNTRKGRET